MSEYKKEIGAAAVIALIAALGVGLLAITLFPNPSGTSSTSTASEHVPKALLGYLDTTDVSCSLSTGTCTFTIVNNSTASLGLVGCTIQVIVFYNSTNTTYDSVNGTLGGAATAGISATSRIGATCTIPTTQLAHQTLGSFAAGSFTVKIGDNIYGYPVGDEPTFSFEGTWS